MGDSPDNSVFDSEQLGVVLERERRQADILRAIAATAVDFIFCKGLDRRYTFVNPAMALLLGRPAEEIVGRTPEELFDAQTAATVREVDDSNLAGHVVNETHTIDVGGQTLTLHTVQVPMRDTAGAIIGVCGIVRDVTETVTIERELRRSRAQLLAVVESLPCDFFALDAEGCYFLQNAIGRHYWGDTLGKRIEDVTSDAETQELWRCNNERAMRGETVREEAMLMVGGQRRHVFNVVAPIRNEGRIEGIVGTNIDITAHQEAEAELQRYKVDLERLVEERTHELSLVRDKLQEQLEYTRRMEGEMRAARARERGQVSRDLHDGLGQKLTGIQFLAGALAKQAERAGSPEVAVQARQIAKLACESIGEAKQIAKGILPVELTEHGLGFAIGQLAQTTESVFGIECVYNCPQETVLDDLAVATEMYLIAKEAVTNAVRHAACTRIEILLHPEDAGDVRLRIRDNGVGIPQGPPESGSGLRLMRYRASAIDAALTIGCHPDGGTEVVCVTQGRPTES